MTNFNKIWSDIATVKIGNLEIEGLYCQELDQFGVGVPQLATIFQYFQDSQNQASQKLKRLMGKDFKTHKAKTIFNKNITTYVTLDQFLIVIKVLAKEKHQVDAIEMLMDLAGLSLHQLFSDAFGMKFEKEERQVWLKARQDGKIARRTLTDAIKDYLSRNQCSQNEAKWMYSNVTDTINRGIFERNAAKLKKDWNVSNPRDGMTAQQIRWVEAVEDLIGRLIDKDNLNPKLAAEEALKRMEIPLQK